MDTKKENVFEPTEPVVTADGFEIPAELEAEIKAKVEKLREGGKVKRIYPVVVVGDEYDEKPYYVGYFAQPSFSAFTKYLEYSSSVSAAAAMKELAKDCWLDGDTELINDDSLFLFGTASQLSHLIANRQTKIVNFCKSGK